MELKADSETWERVGFDRVFQRPNIKAKKIKASNYQEFGSFPIIDQGKKQIVGWTDDESCLIKADTNGFVIFGDHTRTLKLVTEPFALGADGTQLLRVNDEFDLHFAFYLLSSKEIPNTGYNRHFKFLKEMDFLVPRESEQIAIAEALSDIDELIAFLRREISKKVNLRTAFTQHRLNFENTKKVKLGNYADFSKGSGLPKSQLTTNGKFKAIHYGELFLKYPESIRRVISRTDTSSNATYSRVNDVLMPSSDVTPTGLAVASCIREDDVILGGDVLIIRPNSASELDGRYLSYVIRNSKQEILKLVRGTTVYHIYGKDMAEFELFLPGIDVQIEIVESLDQQREEISLLEEELQKYEWLKQGMMNDLLTGKVRLV